MGVCQLPRRREQQPENKRKDQELHHRPSQWPAVRSGRSVRVRGSVIYPGNADKERGLQMGMLRR